MLRTKKRWLSWMSLLLLATLPAVAATVPQLVSPGALEEIRQIDGRCPTFSWGAVGEAAAYELAVYELVPQLAAPTDDEHEDAGPVLRLQASVPGGATTWTPSVEQCLTPGAAYAWTVRAKGEVEEADWSEPLFFEVLPAARNVVRQALEVLGRYLAEGGRLEDLGAGLKPVLGGTVPGSDPGERSRAAGSDVAPGRRTGSVASAPGATDAVALVPDVVGMSAHVSDPAKVTFGLHGKSASSAAGSAGVVGESTATTGAATGVLGAVDSAAGVAGAFDNTAGGKILSGRNDAVEVFSVDGAGAVTGDSFLGDGSGLTGVDAATLGAQPGSYYRNWNHFTNVPPGFVDGVDNDSGGDITAVTAGAGLTGGGVLGDVTVAADFSETQARVVGSCPPGNAIVGILADGSVDCGLVIIPLEPLITTVDDPANNVGGHTSIVLGADGLPVISYYDNTARALKVAKCANPSCS